VSKNFHSQSSRFGDSIAQTEKMPYQQRSITELGDLIASSTRKYQDYLIANGIPLPTHAPSEKEIPVNVPTEIANFRQQAIEASHELHELLMGPMGVPFTAYARVSLIPLPPCSSSNEILEYPYDESSFHLQE
jgi:hypothetical protein